MLRIAVLPRGVLVNFRLGFAKVMMGRPPRTTSQPMTATEQASPFLSIVVIVYNIPREASRTLMSLSPEYQGLPAETYEVIVIDNGSKPPLGEERVREMGSNFRYEYISQAEPSPVFALNHGASLARGELLGFIVDGARMASPGLLNYALQAAGLYDNPLIATLPFHLGPKIQRLAVAEGYSREREDRALEAIDWVKSGHRLFEISAFGGSARDGWFYPIAESGCVFLRRVTFFGDLHGYDEAFTVPGGGLASLDFYRRASELDGIERVVILGEATFHQLHRGAFTGASEPKSEVLFEELSEQYRKIRGYPYRKLDASAEYIGSVHNSLESSLEYSLRKRGADSASRSFAVLNMLQSGKDSPLLVRDGAALFLAEVNSIEKRPGRAAEDCASLWTLKGWTSLLPDLRLIGVFQAPTFVAGWLNAQEGVSIDRGLELWRVYHERLLALYRERSFPLIEVDEDRGRTEQTLAKLKADLGLARVPRAEFFGARFESFRPTEFAIPEEVASLYETLQDIRQC